MEIYAIANSFFENCQQLKVAPLSIIDQLREKLTKVAETLTTGLMSHWDIQVVPNGTYKNCPPGTTSSSQPDIQVVPNGTLPQDSIPEPVSVLDPSENTAKNTSNTSHVSTQAGAENTHIEDQSLDFFPGKKNKEADQGFVKTVEVDVLQDTQQETPDRGSNSQGQNCIFMKGNIPGGAGGENFEIEKTPNWVQELEDKVRSGNTLPRSELLALAEYRLGDLASVYRESGRVLDASPNDIKPEFIKFLQWYAFNRHPDIS